MLIGIDGTWNDMTPKPGQRPSNIRRFLRAYIGDSIVMNGIGCDDDNGFILQMLGGAFGLGGKSIIRKAFFKVGEKLEQGERAVLDVVGFSRGGALALHFANVAARKGIPLPSTKRRASKWVPNLQGRGRKRKFFDVYEMRKIKIRWIGLWDTVPAMGIPGNDINWGYDIHSTPKHIPTHHALALDVSDPCFRLHRVMGAEEVWFMGGHSDVGGGSANVELSDCSLNWMMAKARTAGLKFRLKNRFLPTTISTDSFIKKSYHKKTRRRVQKGDYVHKSVCRNAYPQIPWDEVIIAR